jgi:asparagine synthase (glutamine-hydrolysing)
MQTLLNRMDRASAFAGLEARVPFADFRIAEYLWNVPWEFKCRDGVVKGLLRDAFADLLPPELLSRKKSPYPKTYNPNYTRILSERLRAIMHDSTSPLRPLLNRRKVLEFIDSPMVLSRPWFGQLMAAPQMTAYLIQVDYWLRKYA